MAKGYWIGHVDIHNMDGYRAYIEGNAVVFDKYGACFLVRGGRHETPEGALRRRSVLIEFPDYATALACYHSPEYQKLVALRAPHSMADIVVIEGYDGPQP